MELYAGLDLHSRNTYIGIMDDALNCVFKKRVPNDLDQILQTLTPFQDRLKGFVVESTFNLYWLGDGLTEEGSIGAHLAILPHIFNDMLESSFKKAPNYRHHNGYARYRD